MTDELLMPYKRQQRKFCERYVVHFNGKQAAIEAGYAEKSAKRTAHRFMSHPRIKSYIDHLIEEQRAETSMQAIDVKDRLCAEIEADLLDIFDEDGGLLPIRQWPKIWRQGLIASIESGTDRYGNPTLRVRLSDRAKRIEMLGRHLKMFTDKVEGSIEATQIKAEQEALARARREFTTAEIEQLNKLVMSENIDVVLAVERIESFRRAH